MATTPLKTASRALSISTVLVVGFAAWVLTTHGAPPRDSSEPTSDAPRNVSFAAVIKPVPEEAPPLAMQPAPRRRLDADIERPELARTELERIDESYFKKRPDVARVAKSETRSQPRIQPNLARLSDRHPNSVDFDPFDDLDATAEDANRSPRSAQSNSRPSALFRPAEVFPNSESSRVESQLTAMQRQLQQLAQVQSEQKSSDQQRALELLQQIQQQKQSDQIEKLLQELQESKQKAPADPAKPAAPKPDSAAETKTLEPAEAEEPAASKKPGFMQAKPAAGGDSERFESIEFHDADISEALAMLGQLSGMNILVGRGVSGRVPAANLQNITAEQALDAITKSLGYVYERDENFVFVWTATDAQVRKQAARKTMSRVYRPRYVSVKELQTLVTPMLSKPGGLIAVTTPAEVGLEESKTKVGGNSLAQADALLIIDFPEVIAQIDVIIGDIDVPPAQVVIEAMILSVKLTDAMKLGVNFALLEGQNKQLATSGSGSQINGNVGFPNKDSLIAGTTAMGEFITGTSGLKYGFLQGDLSGFIEALETLAETSVVASPSVRVLNKQRAELIIGQRLGYKTVTQNGAQSVENINFLEVGTKLLLRPFVAQDGLVRMEIHPERSDGKINEQGLPESRTTEVTSNVMIRDGSTIVIGGLIEEQTNQTQSRIPGLGALPVVGNLFKSKSNDTSRTELIVLITPRVIRDFDAEVEGDVTRSETERRHQEFREKLSPINRHNLARVEFERAARYFEEGDAHRAKRHIDESLRHNRNDLESLRLRDQIAAALTDKNWFKKLRRKPPTEYHRVSSAPTSQPASLPNGEAIFEQEIPLLSPATPAPIPPAPSDASEELSSPPPSASRAAAIKAGE